MTNKFGRCLITSKDTDTWFRIDDVRLSDLKKYHPKRLLLLVDDMILEHDKDGKLRRQGLLHRDDFVISDWHNTGSISKLFKKVTQEVAILDQLDDKFMNLQLILSPETHLRALAKYCFCLDRTRIDQKHYLLF